MTLISMWKLCLVFSFLWIFHTSFLFYSLFLKAMFWLILHVSVFGLSWKLGKLCLAFFPLSLYSTGVIFQIWTLLNSLTKNIKELRKTNAFSFTTDASSDILYWPLLVTSSDCKVVDRSPPPPLKDSHWD